MGEWINAPIDAFLDAMYRQFVHMPVIAEDLGEKAPVVQPHLRHFQIPGMRVLQFGFGDDVSTSSHSPHNHVINSVAYTGTHDNPTTAGWWMEADSVTRSNVEAYLGVDVTTDNITAHLSRLTMQSVARLAILPLQDALNLDESHRMNTPGGGGGNWSWRYLPEQLTDEVAARLLAITKMTGRI